MSLVWRVNASDSRTKDLCTSLMWSAGIGISWTGGSTKYRKAAAISTLLFCTAWPLRQLDCQSAVFR